MFKQVNLYITILCLIGLHPLSLCSQQNDINKLVPCRKGNKWGLVYPDGTVFYPPVLDSIRLQNQYIIYSAFSQQEYDEYETALVKKGGKWWLLNKKGKLLPPDEAAQALIRPLKPAPPKQVERKMEVVPGDMQLSEERLNRILSQKSTRKPMKAKNGSQFELLDSASKVQIYRNGLPVPGLEGDRYFASRDGDGTYRTFTLVKNGKQALVDANTLEYLTSFEYDYINDFYEGHDWKLVYKGDSMGVVDSRNRVKIPIVYQRIYGSYNLNPADSLPVIVKQHNQFMFYWYASGNAPAAVGVYDSLSFLMRHPEQNRVPVYKAWRKGKTGLVDNRDAVLLTFRYDSIRSTEAPQLLLLKQGLKTGFYNIKTGYLREPEFDAVLAIYRYGNIKKGTEFYILQVRKNRQWYFVDMNGREYICN